MHLRDAFKSSLVPTRFRIKEPWRFMALAPRTHLETPYVFVDAQAYIANGCDWSGTHLGTLLELAREGSLKLLYTTVTRREVLRQIDEKVKDALQRATKVRAMIGHAGFDLTPLNDGQMSHRSAAAFDSYLKAADALEVPTAANLDRLLDDYFERRPPFSSQKPKEFPDAIVGASLIEWSKGEGQPIYIVSADPDFEGYCAANSSLILLKSIPDLLSRAVVSRELLDDLAQRLRESSVVREKLAEALASRPVTTPMLGSWPLRARGRVEEAKITSVGVVNVVARTPKSLICEFEFDAELSLSLRIEDLGANPSSWISKSYGGLQVINRSLAATINADRVSGRAGFSFEKVSLVDNEIVVKASELPPPPRLSGGVFD
jgi:hypothetical protein